MATTGQRAATLAAPDATYEIELIENPRELDEARAHEINEQFAELACRACAGTSDGDAADAVAREGWRQYCVSPGGRVQDHDRVVIVWHEGRLVVYSGWVVERTDSGATLLWWKSAGTDPDYQGRGVFAAAREKIADPRWITSFGPPTYWIARTPNPIIYDTARRWWSRYPEWYEGFFPKLTLAGTLEPLSPDTRATVADVAAALWPDCEFDADRFVVKDFLGKYGRDIWRIASPASPNAATQRYFSDNLRPGNQDALMIASLFYR